MQIVYKFKEVVDNIGVEYVFNDDLVNHKCLYVLEQASKYISVDIEENGYNGRGCKFQ
jgi:hypothetical protein